MLPLLSIRADPAGFTVQPKKKKNKTHKELLTRCKVVRGLPCCLSGKESTCQCKDGRFDPWVGKIPWRREWQPTPVFLPGEYHEQRSLVGYSP